MEKLTRDQLLQGKDLVEEFEVADLGGTVTIRPLTSREWMNLSGARAKELERTEAIKKLPRSNEVKVDTQAIMDINFAFKCDLVALALVDPKLTKEDIGEMKISVVDAINTRIRIISGIDKETQEEIVKFRGE